MYEGIEYLCQDFKNEKSIFHLESRKKTKEVLQRETLNLTKLWPYIELTRMQKRQNWCCSNKWGTSQGIQLNLQLLVRGGSWCPDELFPMEYRVG